MRPPRGDDPRWRAGGLALALGGFSALGLTLAALFATAVLIHFTPPVSTPTPVPQEATA